MPGYSALQAGTAWLAASLTSVALAGVAQKLVTTISAGPVMALGMAMIGGGIVWATRVPVHGHFWSALAGPPPAWAPCSVRPSPPTSH